MQEFKVLSPTKISLFQYKDTKANRALNRVGKDKFFPLNLNTYRNAHYRILDQSKKTYYEVMYRQLVQIDAHVLKLQRIKISYQIFAHNKRSFDTMNFACIIDKYFQDTLVKMGIIPNDGYKIVLEISVLPVISKLELPENICEITVTEVTAGQATII